VKTLSSPQYQRFVSLLKQSRLGKNVSQEQLAQRLGKPQSFVSKFESGERRLDVCEYIDICQALEINPTRIIKALC
jgi:transcriptional regulator with XRE-family HTH domain